MTFKESFVSGVIAAVIGPAIAILVGILLVPWTVTAILGAE